MKEHKPTIKDVKDILRKQVSGWNDKRKSYSRIKLTEQLSNADQRKLLSELRRRFDAYKFTVGNIRWQSCYSRSDYIVGAITFWK
jgi:hypothetical protein